MYASVLIEHQIFDKPFVYKVKEDDKNIIKKGMRVTIPFGKQELVGFVLKIEDNTDVENLKYIKSVDASFIINEELINLAKYIEKTTISSLISSLNVMFPSSYKIKKNKFNLSTYDEYLIIKDKEKAKLYIKNHKRAYKKIELLSRLLNNERIDKKEYINVYKDLAILDIITIEKTRAYRINEQNHKEKKLNLTDDQKKVIDKVIYNRKNTYLIHGVTGSGKTEVYLNLIEKAVKQGKEAIFLLPEISLTNQILDRFYERFGNNVAVIHSGLSDGEKHDEYTKILNKEVQIVVGTRSAIFVPFTNLGIIIIDEEHSDSYKQTNMPRYHALDIAHKRCETHNIPLILGSATPSLETYARSEKGVYELLELRNRINQQMPEIKLVDMASEYKKGNMIISDELDKEIKKALSKDEQIIIFLNRRGFNTIITCSSCGHTYKCPHCEISLTYHKTSNMMRCHYCGYTAHKKDVCDECGEKALNFYGLGTQKVEDYLKNKYKTNIIRMDRDTTTKKGSHKKIIKMIEEKKVDILIGTQMISKGFDFENVTLVGVINGDEMLNIPDFRSSEKTYQMLTQISGRAGRHNKKGKVIIQTFNLDNETINYVKNYDFLSEYKYEMEIRRKLKYPPYFYLTSIKIKSKNYEKARDEAVKTVKYLNKNVKNTIILGPSTASIFRLKNVFRFQIILKYKDFSYIEKSLVHLNDHYKNNKDINIEIDINPNML